MSDYLPPSLITAILCRLPVESLLRFRCVSRQWCSLISSPHFISTHLSHLGSPLLLLRHLSTSPKNQEHYSVYMDSSRTEKFTPVKELNFPFKTRSGNHFRVVGFCNGLFCLSDDLFGYTYTIVLWNPAIRKSITLPKPRVHFGPYGPYMFCLGFGFDRNNCDFKVVRIAYLQNKYGAYSVLPPEVEVYSLSSGLWRTVDSKDVRCKIIEYFYSSVYLNGAIHWVCCVKNDDGEFTSNLLVFDLTDEKFSEMCLPRELVHVSPLDLSVSLCEGQISMFWYEKGRDNGESCDCCAVWVMNQYGEVESWTKKFVVVLEGGLSHAIGFRGNGEFLVEKFVGDLMSYDPERKEFKDLGIHGGKDSFFLSQYAESLVLLDGSSGAVSDPSVASDAEEADSGLSEGGLLQEWYCSALYAKVSLCD
ncbi:F-box/kelch-repeat protein At3g23880-like [Lycium ferocissimum]|uniref:F-box/kelch-repeat protein At3g23880-like n=1 Tax=Lycium ferocissimum TaxID=112874 RepID=UPI002815BDDF|nr:F-box/kelch-repeat protein At3g23880-like [Lycium ferocissimum]